MNKFFRNRKPYGFFLILLLGLTPLLWYKPGFLAFGHDMGYPLNPIGHFLDRLFAWTQRMGLGADQSQAIGGFFIHGFEALLSYLGFSLQVVQKITFIFWFTAPGLAMYYLLSTLHKKENFRFLRLFGSIFYMFNHFLLQGWFVAERTKFSLMVALPIVLALTIQVFERKIKPFKAAILVALTLFFFNGGGSVPLYGALLLSIFLAFCYFTLLNFIHFGSAEIKRTVKIGLAFIFGITFINAYWLIPLGYFAKNAYTFSLGATGGITGILQWVGVISEHASFLNLFRLQGIPDWYNNPSHAYANLFLANPLLIFLSFLLPILAFIGLFMIKDEENKKYILFFSLLALVSMIFVAGSHPPLGFLYTFLVNFIPGFAIFRTPFYKFSPALWLSYAYLIGFTLNYFINWLRKKRRYLPSLISVLSILVVLGYSYPFFTGNFFVWNKPFTTMVKIPDYVFEFGEWVNFKKEDDERILLLPPLNKGWKSEIYTWNYWSLSSIHSLLTRRFLAENDGTLDENERIFIETLYESLLRRQPAWQILNKFLRAKYFLIRHDFFFNAENSKTDSPEAYEQILQESEEISLKQSFGEWDLYQLENQTLLPRFYPEESIALIESLDFTKDKQLLFTDLFHLSELRSARAFYIKNQEEKKSLDLNKFSQVFVIADCTHCARKEEVEITLPEVKLLPGSPFYFLIKIREDRLGKKYQAEENKIDFNLGLSIKRLAEIKKMIELRRNPRFILRAIERYKERIENLEALVDELEVKEERLARQVARVNNFLQGENRTLAFLRMEARDSQVRDSLDKMTWFIRDIYEKNREKELKPLSETERKYTVNLPVEGEYEFLIKNGFDEESEAAELKIDDQSLSFETKLRADGYFSLGKINLSHGQHKILLSVPTKENLIKENTSFTLSPLEKRGCRSLTVNGIDDRKLYEISFDHLAEKGRAPFFIVSEKRENYPPNKLGFKLSEINAWQPFEIMLSPKERTKEIELSFCTMPGYEETSQSSFKNITVKPIIIPTVIFYQQTKSPKTTRPQISFTKINQTKYKIQVKNASEPYFLVFLERFNPGWKAYLPDDKNPLPEDNHFLLNSYANGWYVNKPGDYVITVEYWPQRLLYVGIGISLITFLGMSGYLTYCKFKKI